MITAPPGSGSPDAPGSPAPAVFGEAERLLATVELSLGGMHCNACAVRVEGALTHSTGVVSAAVNLATTKAFVAYDPSAVAPETLCEAVEIGRASCRERVSRCV